MNPATEVDPAALEAAAKAAEKAGDELGPNVPLDLWYRLVARAAITTYAANRKAR